MFFMFSFCVYSHGGCSLLWKQNHIISSPTCALFVFVVCFVLFSFPAQVRISLHNLCELWEKSKLRNILKFLKTTRNKHTKVILECLSHCQVGIDLVRPNSAFIIQEYRWLKQSRTPQPLLSCNQYRNKKQNTHLEQKTPRHLYWFW